MHPIAILAKMNRLIFTTATTAEYTRIMPTLYKPLNAMLTEDLNVGVKIDVLTFQN